MGFLGHDVAEIPVLPTQGCIELVPFIPVGWAVKEKVRNRFPRGGSLASVACLAYILFNAVISGTFIQNRLAL